MYWKNSVGLDHVEPKVHPQMITGIDPVPGYVFWLLCSLGLLSMSELVMLGPTKMLRMVVLVFIIGVVNTMTMVVIHIGCYSYCVDCDLFRVKG